MSTLLFGLNLDGVKARLWSESSADKPDASDSAWDERFSGPEGSIGFQGVPAKPCRVYFSKAGYEDQVWPKDGPSLPVDGAIEIRLVPAGESGALDTYEGGRLEYGFKTEDGAPWQFRGYSVHLLPCLIDRGEDPRPIIREAIGYDANTLIPICMHRSQWKKDNGYLFDPLANEAIFQRVLEFMCTVAAEMKIRLAPAILADADGLSTSQQQRIVDLACEVFARYPLVLPRLGNECNVNGYDPERLNMNKVHHLLWSYGSYGENNPPLHTGARWAEWEGRRDYRNNYHKAMDDAGAGILELNRGYTGSDGRQIGPFRMPVVGIEMPYFADSDPDHVGDRRWTDPKAALQLGLELGANAAGGGAGTSLGLECKPNGPLAAECMREQFRGMRAAFLR